MRKAATMLELIFAIVIIGIAVMSIPTMLTQSSTAILTTVQQEAIMAASTQIGNVISHPWDQNQTDPEQNGGYIKVVNVNTASADDELDMDSNITRTRKGHFLGDKRRKFYQNSAPTSEANLGSEGGELNDIDDFIGNNQVLVQGNAAGNDYIRTYNVNIDVDYISDAANYTQNPLNVTINQAAVANPTNIKLITVVVTSNDDPNLQIQLSTFASNIGEGKLLTREFYN